MRSDDIAAIGVLVVVLSSTVALVGPWLKRRSRLQQQRLDILQESLQHPTLDAETRRQILRVVAREHEASALSFLGRASFWQKLVFGGGWLAFVFCGGMALLSWSGLIRRHIADEAVVCSLVGLAIASVPIAMRELTARRPEANARSGNG